MLFDNKKRKSPKQLTNAERLATLLEEISTQQKQKELSDLLRANAISSIKEKADAYNKDRYFYHGINSSRISFREKA